MPFATTESPRTWTPIESFPVPGFEGTKEIRVRRWDHANAPGGNHAGEHWVYVHVIREGYEECVESCFYWGQNASHRAYEDAIARYKSYKRQIHTVAQAEPLPTGPGGFTESYSGRHMTLEDWLEYNFHEYDGTGYYATATQMTDLLVDHEAVDTRWSHIVWFNK